MVLLEILTIVILTIVGGAVYSYLKPGKEDRKALLKKGLWIGILLASVFVALEIEEGFLLLGSVIGAIVFIGVIIVAVLFIFGTFIGDWLEQKVKARSLN
ncbi:MAG TPA: hypothetical protein VN316_00670 [candidate division Zixibacteria bacterium]|nr:hypothetical protein [candidate division Zixibacteria bacterium]